MVGLKKAVARLMPERLERPLRSSSFRRLALGKSISYLGDWLMVAVLVGWVYQSTSSVSQVALLMAIRLVPPIVGGGLAASLVDRLPRVRVLVWSEAACGATIAGALVGVVAGSRPLVFAFVGLCGLVSMVSTVAGNGNQDFSADGIPAASAALFSPLAVAVDTSGNLYFAEASRIRAAQKARRANWRKAQKG